jgi:hypothetical protein
MTLKHEFDAINTLDTYDHDILHPRGHFGDSNCNAIAAAALDAGSRRGLCQKQRSTLPQRAKPHPGSPGFAAMLGVGPRSHRDPAHLKASTGDRPDTSSGLGA